MVLIKLQQNQITPQIKVPVGVAFYFSDRDLVNKNKKAKLNFSPQLLSDLRYYSLRPTVGCHAAPLNFTSYHLQQSQPIAVIRSKISLQGTIKQEVCGAYLQRPELLQSIVSNHYWLSAKICNRLSLNYKSHSKFLAIAFTVLVAIVVFLLVLWLPFSWFGRLLVSGLIAAGCYSFCDRFVQYYCAQFILKQLLFGFLAHNPARRRFGWLLWRYFG